MFRMGCKRKMVQSESQHVLTVSQHIQNNRQTKFSSAAPAKDVKSARSCLTPPRPPGTNFGPDDGVQVPSFRLITHPTLLDGS